MARPRRCNVTNAAVTVEREEIPDFSINYLHYGDFFGRALRSRTINTGGVALKQDVLCALAQEMGQNKYVAEVVRTYGSRRAKVIDLDNLLNDLRGWRRYRLLMSAFM